MSTALLAALLFTCKTSSLKAKPWTTPEFLALHDCWCQFRERFYAGGKCPAVQWELLTLQKQASKKARALRREWLDATLSNTNIAFTSGWLREGWSQLKPLLTKPKRWETRVHGVHDSSGRLVMSVQEGAEVHAKHLQQCTAQQPWTGLPVPSVGWVPCGWHWSDHTSPLFTRGDCHRACRYEEEQNRWSRQHHSWSTAGWRR